jgi:iron complex transport system ATP-binding protein
MIAKALAQHTPIIYLDEPTAFLDYPSKVDMLMLLSRISREAQKTVFLSTHDLELALQTADTIWLMSRDEGLQIGTPHELAASGALSRFVERSKDITFDTQTLSVQVNKSFKS